jgi:hypothetical protein
MYLFMHLTQTPLCSRTLLLSRVLCPLQSSSLRVLELLLLRRRAARLVAEEDVDVVLVVVVVGGPCLSHSRKFVVWTRRMTMTSFLLRRRRYCPPAHMEETYLFMDETCIV